MRLLIVDESGYIGKLLLEYSRSAGIAAGTSFSGVTGLISSSLECPKNFDYKRFMLAI